MRLAIADHLGSTASVTATAQHVAADRRRRERAEPRAATAAIRDDRVLDGSPARSDHRWTEVVPSGCAATIVAG